MAQRLPLVPEDIGRPGFQRRDPQLRLWIRTATTLAIAELSGRTLGEVAAELWNRDTAAEVTRAAVSPANTTTPAWASVLAGTAVGAWLGSLAPSSAAARLFEACARFDMAGVASIGLPRLSAPFPAPGFPGEGQPIPVVQGAFATEILGPVKAMKAIAGLTGELVNYSATAAELIVETAMRDASAAALDAIVFSASAATANAPAGLLAGVAAIPGTAGGGITALVSDMKALAGALATAGGGTQIMLFAHPTQAITLKLLTPAGFDVPVISSNAIPAGTLIAIEVGAIASGFSGLPEVTKSDETLLHFETVPAAVGVPGAPNIVSAPLRSLWQTDTLALKLILRCAWAVRAPGMVQAVTGATW